METMKAIARRKSARSYKQDQIPNEVLNTILAAGYAAPVASGKYDSLHLTVIQNKEMLGKISDSISAMMKKKNAMSFGAPTLIIVSSKEPHFPGIDYANAGCVLENMVIAATDQKVDSVLFGGAAVAVKGNEELRKELLIPHDFHPVLSLALGYATVPNQTEKVHEIATSYI